MADPDPLAIPFVPPTDVVLIDTDTGKPKTAFQDWLQSLWSYMKENIVDLTTKVTTLISTTGETSAEVEQITQALTDGTGAYGSFITSIDTKADEATASGEVYIEAMAGPSGTSASYGWRLKADGSFAGMQAMALSGGGSAIGFAANQLQFTDSGTATPVFTYSSGVWVFNVPLVIRSGTSGARQVITNENTKIYDASNVLRVAIGINI